MISYLLQGASLGIFAGANPGPFQAFLLSESLSKGWKRTLPATAAPLLSDGPIILVMLFVLSRLSDAFLLGMRIVGGVFILYLAVQTFSSISNDELATEAGEHTSLLQAGLLNLLNPNPWLFWALVGGPIITRAWQENPSHAFVFIGGFFVVFIVLNICLIVFFDRVGRADKWLQKILVIVSGILLVAFGVYQLASVVREYVII